ncbi:MAG: FlgD immunoglobulin-like domain containing protein, partial [Elusimicrobiota bacterium]
NGNFSFSGVPPGVYLLRNNSKLDAAGDQMPQFSQTVVVTGTVAGLVFQAGSGNTLSGSVLAQSGVVLSRSMNVNLMNSAGQLTASAPVVFNNSNSASFSFPQLVDGNYTLLLQDSSYPKAYAAAPLQVRMSGQNLSGQNLAVLPTGTIKTKVVIQVIQSNGKLQSRLINPATVGLLPTSFKISAIADPWFSGGLGNAGGPNGGTAPVLDNGNEFVVDGLIPGTYDVKFTAQGVGTGGVSLVDTVVPGVVVTAGNISDLGFVNLGGGSQLTGVVTDASSGAPLANIHVHAVPSQRGSGVDSTPIDATTDGSGSYVLPGLDPQVRFYDVYAAYRGVEVQGESLLPYQLTISPSVDLNAVSSLNFPLAPAAYSVTGQIAVPAGGTALGVPGSGGQTAQGALIYFQRTGVIPVSNPIADIQFQTDYNGRFTIPSLTTGTYQMIATSLGYASLNRLVTITTASVNVGTLTMTQGATLTGSLTNPDGSNPSLGQVAQILAVTSDLSNILAGSLTTNPNTQTATAYTIAGFKPGLSYRVILLDSQNGMVAPPEAAGVVFPSTGTATINIVYRPVAPLVIAVAERQGSGFQLEFDMSQPLRAVTAADSNLPAILTPVSAAGTLSLLALSQDREHLTAYYQPGVKESSFTFHLKGYSTLVNPASADPVNSQFLSESTVTFFNGIDGLGQTNVANLQGGDVLVPGDNGRVTLPPGSFSVAASSSVLITLQVAGEPLNGGLTTSGFGGAAAARLLSRRYGPPAYPTDSRAGAAGVPPSVNPLSSFYNIFLPLGVSTALSKPAQLTVAYSSGSDPTTLNLYWYNPAANAYVLTQDVTGAPPVINTANHTITLNVAHFSTYVLFNSAQAVITGGTGAGAFQAGNFPNPFDLGPKLVTPLHAVGGGTSCNPNCTINGTMISASIPPNLSGEATVNIFNVAGTRVRTIDFGAVQGGTFYYQNWDGTNDSGAAVASGVYIGELKVGSQTTFFKMAIIKGSGR